MDAFKGHDKELELLPLIEYTIKAAYDSGFQHGKSGKLCTEEEDEPYQRYAELHRRLQKMLYEKEIVKRQEQLIELSRLIDLVGDLPRTKISKGMTASNGCAVTVKITFGWNEQSQENNNELE